MKTSKEIIADITKTKIEAELKIISLGLGVQSTAVYLMSSTGVIDRADYAIFSDPGAEHQDTYDLEKWLVSWQKKNDGIPIIVTRKKNLYKDIMQTQNSRGARFASIPAFSESGGMVRRQCTGEYKIQPVIQETRKLHGLKKRKWMKPTEMWLGISLDEIQRMKESQLYNIKYFYPLIYHRISRNDCVEFFKDNNFPVPVKSSCVFCPYHSNKFWKELYKENGYAWKMSVIVDKKIRKKHNMRGEMYLHPSRKPLDEIDFTDDQLEMFEGYDCEGYCGL